MEASSKRPRLDTGSLEQMSVSHQILGEVRSDFNDLRNAIAALYEEHSALRDLLLEAGMFSLQTLDARCEARLHRRRFTQMCRSHECRWEVSAVEAFGAHGFAWATASFIGVGGLTSLRASCRSIAESTNDARQFLRAARSMKLLVCGGGDGQNVLRSCEYLDVASQSWKLLPSMTERRSSTSAAVVGGSVFVCGGENGHGILNTAEHFDPLTLTWKALSPMHQQRSSAAVVGIAGYVYACGGYDGSQYLQSVECFDIVVNAWNLLSPMALPRAWLAAAVVTASGVPVIACCGGHNGQEELDAVESFRVGDHARWDHWPRMSHRRAGPAAAVVANDLYVCGGFDGQHPLSSVEFYSLASSSWTLLRPMSQGRTVAAAAVIAGKLFICGGENGSREALRSVEEYDADTGQWIEKCPMMQARFSLAATATAM